VCVSVSPGIPVRFSDTVLYAADVIAPDGGTVHVIGYQNKVQGPGGLSATVASWLPFGRTGNAMILPFPAEPGTMTAANVLDTEGCRDILQDMAEAVTPRPVEWMIARGGHKSWGEAAPKVQIFRAAGIYTVVLAQDARDIPAALAQVPRSKRPALNPALFDAYARWYPGWTVALCCFNNRRAQLAHPLLWWYRPQYPESLFLPGLDCHTGDVPDLDATVSVDHVVAVGSHRLENGSPVRYRDALPGRVAPYLRPSVLGRRFREILPNGDFVCRVADVAANRFAPERVRPPAA
jgi:hypothetical protein